MNDRIDGNSQRVRIGLTGLAAVFVMVMLAAVFTRASDEEPITANRIEEVATDGENAHAEAVFDEQNEPLAKLRVAPGSGTDVQNSATDDTVPVEDPLSPQRRR